MKNQCLTKRKVVIVTSMMMFASSAFADTGGIQALSNATGGIGTYMPYVRGVCYVIAAIIAVVGAMAVYSSMVLNPQRTTKRISMTVGSCMTFVMMAIALPQFFGYDASGSLIASNGGGTGSGGGSGLHAKGPADFQDPGDFQDDFQEFNGGTILTDIPDLGDSRWEHLTAGELNNGYHPALPPRFIVY